MKGSGKLSLFEGGSNSNSQFAKPLAEKIRPTKWEDFQGLESLDTNLIKQLKEGSGKPPSLILWGPPGSGKTTLAKLLGASFSLPFVEFSAVLGGVKEVREIIETARTKNLPTILFMDEIHRFNKAQQDAFLPHVEQGTIILVGATTENPSFYLTPALLSRCKVVTFSPHSNISLSKILVRALDGSSLKITPEAESALIECASGDARRFINLIESFVESIKSDQANSNEFITIERVKNYLDSSKVLFYDRSGEEHYNVVSAFIKSMRGSDADGALYWGFRMIESGEDPRFVIRRMIIFASEDIGNADPRALQLAVATLQAYEHIGLPEGKIPIAQCITYLATAPKSNRSYKGMKKVLGAIRTAQRAIVPLHLRNAPTDMMKSLGYGENYHYPHDSEGAYVKGVQYLPDEISGAPFYEPSERGYEKNISERLRILKGIK